MQGERVLVTGGAGFIGSRLVASLVDRGNEVLAFDNLHPQVHGAAADVRLAAPLVRGDVCDRDALQGAVHGFAPTVVVHLAAETGTGQSADEPVRYAQVNVVGTANLIEAMRSASRPPRRVLLAATRAVYGEGAYADAQGRVVVPPPRLPQDMAAGRFDPCDGQGRSLEPRPTPETVRLVPGSVYGSTKLMQEYLLQQSPAPWDLVILRLQNVYGPGQSLRNPYTGVLSIFCQQALAGRTLNIFEDGRIHRDFVHVDDVVRAFVVAGASPAAAGQVINIGTGSPAAILDVARLILSGLGLPPDRCRVSGDFRAGDIRHAVADVGRARDILGWRASIDLEAGIRTLVEWARSQPLQTH
jgi:dTDP-L-rhamnose 4-epimerase